MRAVVAQKYGPPEVLKIVEIDKPKPKAQEVLVKIKASAVNSADVRTRALNAPFLLKPIMRLALGLAKPRKPLGVVFSGVVEEVGSKVTLFKPGDEVYASTGFSFGGNAEYMAFGEHNAIALKPKTASFEEAAAIPFGGTTALYFLDKAGIGVAKNKKVLIYGATGAVGTAAVQIAKHYDAEVTAVCGSDGAELVASLNADRVIIYTEEDFTKNDDKYDIIFDTVGKTSKKACLACLASSGTFITTAGLDTASESKAHMELLTTLYDNSEFRAVIDKIYPMEDIVEAHRYVDTGHKKGSVVVTI
jgi:NADPH:quinone reductase-like Zn-dependent oxidoreductase